MDSADPAPAKSVPGAAGDPLQRLIVREIRRGGPMTMARFMALALYHPRWGYYRRPARRIGAGGDYFTSPDLHEAFGVMLARQLGEMWAALDRPAAFTAVEMGAGKGLLALDILRAAPEIDPAFAEALRYLIVETSPDFVRRQRALLRDAGLLAHVEWRQDLEADFDAGEVVGCCFSNELVDAFPVHAVAMQPGALRELYVAEAAGELVQQAGDLSTPVLAEPYQEVGLWPREGCRAEVNLAVRPWLRQVSRVLGRGFVLTIDYGGETAELLAPARCDGTLRSFYQHQLVEDPLARPGQQDITASVDFTVLQREGEKLGLLAVGLTSQAEFLNALGIGDYLVALQERARSLDEYYQARARIADLLRPDRMGQFRVLCQYQGVPRPRLRAFPDG